MNLLLKKCFKGSAAAISVIAAALSYISCNGPASQTEQEISFKLYDADGAELKSLQFAYAESERTLSLMSSATWAASITPESDWITIEPASGSKGQRKLNVKVTENPDKSAARTCSIVFSSGDTKLLSIPVSQSKNDGVVPVNPDIPKADILDVVFRPNNTAINVAPSKLTVQTLKGPLMVNYPAEALEGRITAHFSTELGAASTDGYYKVDYSSLEEVKTALADGHSIEVMFKLDERNPASSEVKMFSSTQSGGVAMMLTNSSKGADITYLPNVTTTGKSNWIWTQSGIVPEVGRYYHVVGVWNKSEGRAYIYVNGVLKGTQNASGDFFFPSTGSHWFCVGGDPASSGASECGFKGDVAIARIYDNPLTQKQVTALYEQAAPKEEKVATYSVKNLLMKYQANVFANCKYHIYGSGFARNDKIVFESAGTDSEAFEVNTENGDGKVLATLPATMKNGEYRVSLLRDGNRQPLGSAVLTFTEDQKTDSEVKVVAHRTYHKSGSPQNSLAGLKAAQQLGIFGAEIDVWITTDGVVVVNHDPKFPGDSRRIDESTFDDLSDIKLANGESIPTLEAFLDQMKAEEQMKLVIEIKSHSNDTKNFRAVDECMRLVKEKKLESRVMYIAFSHNICKRIVANYPEFQVQYLNGNLSPAQLKADGIHGLDYQASVLTNNPDWIKQAHDLGLSVNVWTVNTSAQMLQFMEAGVDMITTDDPVTLKELVGKPFVTK